MYTKPAFTTGRAILGAAALAGTLLAGTAAAKDPVTVAYQVTTRGLDVSQPAGAHELYLRLEHAAEVVCTHGMRVDLTPSSDPQGCYESALAEAVRSAKVPLLTQVYLGSHSVHEAAAHGIDVPVRMAAK